MLRDMKLDWIKITNLLGKNIYLQFNNWSNWI